MLTLLPPYTLRVSMLVNVGISSVPAYTFTVPWTEPPAITAFVPSSLNSLMFILQTNAADDDAGT